MAVNIVSPLTVPARFPVTWARVMFLAAMALVLIGLTYAPDSGLTTAYRAVVSDLIVVFVTVLSVNLVNYVRLDRSVA